MMNVLIDQGLNQKFCLQPFQLTPATAGLTLTGSICRQNQKLMVQYQLSGNLAGVVTPTANPTPQRLDNLWQYTCFEFFLGLVDALAYWEFNLSPSGDWQAYAFTDCRHGLQVADAITHLPATISATTHQLNLSLELDLSHLVHNAQPLMVGITTVIEHVVEQGVGNVVEQPTSELSYWALTHPGPDADFHRRDSFILEV